MNRKLLKQTIEIYGYIPTEEFIKDNKISHLRCRFSVWLLFKKHLFNAFQETLQSISNSDYKDSEFYDHQSIQNLYELNLFDFYYDRCEKCYLAEMNNPEIIKSLINYELYGFYIFLDLLNNLEDINLMNKYISVGSMYDIIKSFSKIIPFISDTKSLKCANTIIQIFKNYIDLNSYTAITVSSIDITNIIEKKDVFNSEIIIY